MTITRAATVRERVDADRPDRPRFPLHRTTLRSLTVAALAAILAGCGAKEEPPPTPPPAAASTSSETADAAEPTDADLIARFAGTYARESYGHRVMVVRPDGTATMTVDVDPWYQPVTGPRITVEIAWELTGDPGDERRGVHFASVSGTPESSFVAVTKLFGTEADWKIETADDAKLVLYDPEDDETVEWVRVPAPTMNGDAAAGSLPAP